MISFLISHLFYYLCILKSEFDIVAELSCVYGEIDTPTEKESAEINEINSRTAMNYINSGAFSPDEIRNVLREDTNSAFNALEGDAPNDPIDFDPDNDPDNDSFNDNAATGDEWSETDHPRKPNGQFGEGGANINQSKETTQEEVKRKINSVKIDPQKDNFFPELNKEEQIKLGVDNQKIRLKKSIYERNQKHNDVNMGNDEELIGKALYSPEEVVPGNKEGYYHLITRIKDNNNSLVLIDIDTNSNDGYIDIVHYYALNDKNRRRTIRKGQKNN